MRGSVITSLGIVCLLGAAGCASNPANALATHLCDGFSVVGNPPVGDLHPATPAKTAGTSPKANSSGATDMDAAVDLAEGIPYVRSEPHKVPPFPLVLNETIQRYVDAFVEHNAGIRESFRRSRRYLPTMIKVLENHDLPPDLVYLSFAESTFSSKGAGPWQLSLATARRFDLNDRKST